MEINRLITGFYSTQSLGLALAFCAQPIIFIGISLLGSCMTPIMANGVAAFILYLVGIVGGIVEQVGALIKNGYCSTLLLT